MKKAIIPILILILSSLSLIGCAKKEEDVVTTIETTSTEDEEESDYEDYLRTLITKDELLAFTPDETKDFFETYIPNYRAAYQISATTELTDDDWENLKILLSYTLYNTAMTDEELSTDASEADEIAFIKGSGYQGVDEDTKTEIEDYYTYGLLTGNDIQNMSLESFKSFFKDYYIWAAGSEEGYEEYIEAITSDEIWAQLQTQLAEEIDKTLVEN